MKRKLFWKWARIAGLTCLTLLALVPSAQAFETHGGDSVIFGSVEVIEDDLYVATCNFTLEGTINGDLVVIGSIITINGTVEGDLIAAGQRVVINGSVTDDVRIAGAILRVGNDASLGDDLVAAGASLETQDGSKVNGDTFAGAGQILLAGDIVGNALVGTRALEIRGEIDGDVKADVVNRQQGVIGLLMAMFFSGSGNSMPDVLPGLTISNDARIKGNLDYTESQNIEIPADVVGGKVTHSEPVVGSQEAGKQSTPAQAVVTWTFDLLRNIVTLTPLGEPWINP